MKLDKDNFRLWLMSKPEDDVVGSVTVLAKIRQMKGRLISVVHPLVSYIKELSKGQEVYITKDDLDFSTFVLVVNREATELPGWAVSFVNKVELSEGDITANIALEMLNESN